MATVRFNPQTAASVDSGGTHWKDSGSSDFTESWPPTDQSGYGD